MHTEALGWGYCAVTHLRGAERLEAGGQGAGQLGQGAGVDHGGSGQRPGQIRQAGAVQWRRGGLLQHLAPHAAAAEGRGRRCGVT